MFLEDLLFGFYFLNTAVSLFAGKNYFWLIDCFYYAEFLFKCEF